MYDIREVAEKLDSMIEKSIKLEQRDIQKSLNKRTKRRELRKSISFNPLQPVDMGRGDHQYHNPYQQQSDGSFMPYTADYWLNQIENKSYRARHDYREGYDCLRDYFRSEKSMRSELLEATDRLIKAKKKEAKEKEASPFKAGSKHTHNGVDYERDDKGNWNAAHKEGEHPVEIAAKEHHAKVKDTLDQRESGSAKEPNFDDRKASADQKAKELKEWEKELTEFEDELRHKEHDLRQRELDTREGQLNEGKTQTDIEAESQMKAEAGGEPGEEDAAPPPGGDSEESPGADPEENGDPASSPDAGDVETNTGDVETNTEPAQPEPTPPPGGDSEESPTGEKTPVQEAGSQDEMNSKQTPEEKPIPPELTDQSDQDSSGSQDEMTSKQKPAQPTSESPGDDPKEKTKASADLAENPSKNSASEDSEKTASPESSGSDLAENDLAKKPSENSASSDSTDLAEKPNKINASSDPAEKPNKNTARGSSKKTASDDIVEADNDGFIKEDTDEQPKAK